MTETHLRSVVKGVTWRALATADTVVLSYLILGSSAAAFTIGFIELFTKTGLYYFHERGWTRICKWQEHPTSEVRDGGHDIDSHSRSALKGVSWRFFGTLDTVIIALFVTHTLTKALTIGVTELFTKVLLYYLHERAWTRVRWGLVKKVE